MPSATPISRTTFEYGKYWDREGILWWTQLSAHIWYDTPEFRENFKTMLRRWVKERRNSPSVVMWGLQNESTLPRDFAEECCDIIREMDPTGPQYAHHHDLQRRRRHRLERHPELERNVWRRHLQV